jgi:signal transduction histidine kinase
MRSTLFVRLGRRWKTGSLNVKLLLTIVSLMLVSLLVSLVTFVVGTALTQDRLVEQQLLADAELVSQVLEARARTVATASDLLANDPHIVTSVQLDSEKALGELNSRAIVVRDRFDLDLIQIYDGQGQARTNLMLSSLYRESSLLSLVETIGPVVRVVDGHMLLLSRVTMPEGEGTVVTGLDLETELNRLILRYRLSADLGLSVDDFQVATRESLKLDADAGPSEGYYRWNMALHLGVTPVQILLLRSTTDVAHVTGTGVMVMVGSTVLTTALLVGVSVLITRSIAQPIKQLSIAAESVAQGDLSQRVEIAGNPFAIGEEDEIGVLATVFNEMVERLRGLYETLEAKVKARTQELATAAEVARAVSSSLDLDVALRRSLRLIHQQFGFYDVAIYVVEADRLVLREATSEGGRRLKAREFQVTVGHGSLVGCAATTRQPCVAQDITQDPRYLPVPELANVASEATIPLLVGETVIGVLDVQSRHKDTFTPEMVQLLVTLADQLATGVRNAQLYTQQRQTAERLSAANARLQELDEIKNQFIQNVSHELRTPLALIRGHAEMLESGMLGELEGEQCQSIDVIARRARVMAQLVEDITALLEVEVQEAPETYVDVTELTKVVVKDFATLAERNCIDLGAEISAEVPPVRGREHQLRKVWDNLINNALKFTLEGGRVRVRLYCKNGRVTFQVSDTGIGIPPEKQAHVFERFYQVDGSIRRRYGGSGLGLALVKEITQAHGGEVTLESAPEAGSTFTVVLPSSDCAEHVTLWEKQTAYCAD